MQLTKVVPVEGGSITVKELRVKDVRGLMADAGRFENIDLKDLFLNRLDEAAGILAPLLDFNGVALGDLTFGELDAVRAAFVEVNQAFLDLTGLAAVLSPAAPMPEPTPAPNLTGLASSSSREATAA